MLISEIVERLREIAAQEGDLEVRVLNDYDGQIEHLEPEVSVFTANGERYALVQ